MTDEHELSGRIELFESEILDLDLWSNGARLEEEGEGELVGCWGSRAHHR